MALFTIAFGTRQLDAAERHEGMVAAIAFESIVKLRRVPRRRRLRHLRHLRRLRRHLRARGAARPDLAVLMAPLGGAAGSYASWVWLTVLSMLAIMFLPRQFQVAVIENTDERHLKRGGLALPALHARDQRLRAADRLRRAAALPAGRRRRRHLRPDAADGAEGGGARAARVHRRPVGGHRHGDRRDDRAVHHGVQRPRDADPAAHARACGSPSSATSRACCSTSAAAAIVAILHGRLLLLPAGRRGLRAGLDRAHLLRRGGAVRAGRASAACTGRAARGIGALAGLVAGFLRVDLHAAAAGVREVGLARRRACSSTGRWASSCCGPPQLFGLAGLDQITHAMIWSMIANVGAYVLGLAWRGRQSAVEHAQATLFVDVYQQTGERGLALARGDLGLGAADAGGPLPGPGAGRGALHGLRAAARGAAASTSSRRPRPGALRRAAARRHHRRGLGAGRWWPPWRRRSRSGLEEVMTIIDEASQMIAYSHRLEEKQQRARGGDAEPAGGQRAPEGARPPEGRLHLHRDARAAHAAHLDPRVLRDPARQPGPRSGRAPALPRRSSSRSRSASRASSTRCSTSRRSSRGSRSGARPELDMREIVSEAVNATSAIFKGARRARRDAARRGGARGDGRPRPPHAGAAEPAVERGQVLHRPERGAWRCACRGTRAPGARRRARTTAWGSAAENQALIFEKFRQVGDTLTAEAGGHGPRARHLPADRRPFRRAAVGRERAGPRLGVLVRPACRLAAPHASRPNA